MNDQRQKDPQPNSSSCLSCRLIGGFSILAIATYLYALSKRRGLVEKNVMRLLSVTTGGLGVARLMDAELFQAKK